MPTNPAVWFPNVRCHSGTDTFTERLCRALNAQGIRAEITWLPHRAEYAPWSVPVPKPPTWANVVHINSWLPPRFVPPGLPIVVTVHSSVHDPALLPYKSRLQALYHKHWIHPIEAANLARAHCVVAVSHYTAAQIEASFGIRDIQVIHNGIDCQAFAPVARTAPNRPFRLLYVGNWSARKGVDLLGPIMERLGNCWVPDDCVALL
ncbi:glycosyltransferase [Tepidiphilus baoligensis]|uniref:glycosyltransferase n=1 Tax=Tepidiphilus baoligensis TaxID=2698687 RepID=UPI00145DAEFD|nr:glycosyltransferase [Tepidiphilus baoligensis]